MRFLAFAGATMFVRAPLHACAVCFGQTGDSNISRAYFWGILLMLLITGSILAVLGYAVYRIEKAHQEAEPSSP